MFFDIDMFVVLLRLCCCF